MKLLLCLAMSLGLSAILYFYMKQKISNIENRLNTLSDLLQTLTNEFCRGEVKTIIPLENSLYTAPIFGNEVSDEESLPELNSDSEGETEGETDTESESEEESVHEPDVQEKTIEYVELNEPVEPVVVHKETKSLEINLNEPEVSPVLIKVSDDDVLGTKHIQVNTVDYSQLSVKELKQKVKDLGGPSSKTKPELINFLKNKV